MRDQQRQGPTELKQISEVRSRLNTLVNRVYRYEAWVAVEKSGIPVAALVSAADLDRLNRLDQERAERFAVIDEMRQAFAGVPQDEIEREAARSIAGVRAEMAAEREQRAASGRCSARFSTPLPLCRLSPRHRARSLNCPLVGKRGAFA